MPRRQRLEFAPETIAALAQRLADYRLGGCPSGEAAAIMAATRKVAQKHGRSYSELWAMVHAAAYAIIDRDPRAAIG